MSRGKARCKRGHERTPGAGACTECRRERERRKYKENKAFREAKKAQIRAYKRKFRDENGFWQAELYRK